MTLLGSRRARTTAYQYPQSNGMVERFHRQLKAALKAQHNPASWVDALPLVLLGIRTALKEDLSATTAEMVYGTTLRLPGELFYTHRFSVKHGPHRLCLSTQSSHAMCSSNPTPNSTTDWSCAKYIGYSYMCLCDTGLFVNHYNHPMMDHIQCWNELKSFSHGTLMVRRTLCLLTDSVDRLKPTHLDTTDTNHPPSQSQPAPTTRVTRSERHVHWSPNITTYVS